MIERLPAAAALILLLSLLGCPRAHASAFPEQTVGSPVDNEEAFREATTEWESPLFQSLLKARSVLVVTTADPRATRLCHVRAVQKDRLTCSRKFHNDLSYPRADILAVVAPRDHDGRVLAITASIAGALIAAGFFAGPAAPVLWVVGGLAVLALGAEAMGDNGPFHDTVLYYAPGPQPSLPLQ